MTKIRVVKPGFILPQFTVDTIDSMVAHIERCGRVCYKSEDRITSESGERFIRRICKNNHESVLEHGNLTAIVTCSRACSHQLVRHRVGCAYSQESQRYCDYGKRGLQVICPPSIGIPEGDYDEVSAFCPKRDETQKTWFGTVFIAYNDYNKLRGDGIPPEDARYLLPNCTKTELAVTYNLRMWRHVFKERVLNRAAQWEIKELFQGVLYAFVKHLPCVFNDLVEQLGGYDV